MKIFSAAAVALIASASLANAAEVLDQQNDQTVHYVMQARSIDYWGQTFTLSQTGTMGDIKLDIGDYQVPAVDVDFHLARIVGGSVQWSSAYDMTVSSNLFSTMGTGSGPASKSDWLDLDFSAFDISVAPGDQFALAFHSPISFEDTGPPNWEQINWFLSAYSYTGGTLFDIQTLTDGPLYHRTDASANFQAFVNVAAVPEPATWALFILGFGAIGATLRHRRGLVLA